MAGVDWSVEPAGPIVRTLADVPVELVSWLWPGYLPAGKLVVLDGDPSVGKSTCTTDLAARVSTGSGWPDGSPGSGPADVLLLSAEDGLSDTIAPRLTVAGADLSRVHALLEVPVAGEEGAVRMVPPSLPRDIPVMEQVIRINQVALVVIDVLMAYLNGRVDSHRDQDVRGVLHQLAAMADRTGATVVLIRHLNKAGGANALYRGGGSIGIIGAARAAYIIGRDPDDNDRRIFACSKLNIAAEPPTLAYRLISDDELGCARVEWEPGPVDLTAAALLSAPRNEEERGERDEAAEWLSNYLSDAGGSAKASDVFKAARADGLAERTLKRARDRAGVTSERRGFGQGSVWSLNPFGPHSGHWGQRSEAGTNGMNAGPNGDSSTGSPPSVPAFISSNVVSITNSICAVCGGRLNAELVKEGAGTHPTCDPDWRQP